MPKRTDIHKILIIGSGPIVISQACEFDYSGAQACKALKEEGYEVVLVNSNPATIMTDPEMAHSTYIEPITPEVVEKIIAKESRIKAIQYSYSSICFILFDLSHLHCSSFTKTPSTVRPSRSLISLYAISRHFIKS